MQPADTDAEATTAIPVQRANGTDRAGSDETATRAIPVSQSRTGDSEAATERVNARGEGTRGEGSDDNPHRRADGVSAQDLLRREGRL